MSDVTVAEALRSSARLVVLEAPGGCGKTFQGAEYAREIAPSLGEGRLLILTHTNAACDVFAARTKGNSRRVEIRTIDSLISEIASAYHKALGLPSDAGAWARQETNGYGIVAAKTAAFLHSNPMVSRFLAHRYPVVVCDEHQDASADQHAIIMTLLAAGSRLRVFADPMQQIFNGSKSEAAAAERQWVDLKEAADRFEELDTPHRWLKTQPKLGAWILQARATLRDGGQIDLTPPLPAGLDVHYADNTAAGHGGFSIAPSLRTPIYAAANGSSLLVLTGHNDTVTALRAFFNRRIPIGRGMSETGLVGCWPISKPTKATRCSLPLALSLSWGQLPPDFHLRPSAIGLSPRRKEVVQREASGRCSYCSR